MFTLRESLYDKLDGFGNKIEEDQKLFKNLAIFDFESICIPPNELKDTNTTTWVEKFVPISAPIASNFLLEFIFSMQQRPQDTDCIFC